MLKIIFLFLLIFACDKKNQKKMTEVKIAEVSYVKRDVKRRLHNNIDWNNVANETPVFQKDSIRTLEASSVDIKFNDGSTLSVDENSLIVIERPEIVVGNINTKILLEEGSFRQTLKPFAKGKVVTSVTAGKVTAMLTSGKGKIGIRKSYDKLKIAVFEGKTEIKTIIPKQMPLDKKKAKSDQSDLKMVGKVAKKIIEEKEIEKKVMALKKEEVNDLLEVAVYSTGEAVLSIDEEEKNGGKEYLTDSSFSKGEREILGKTILLKPNEVIRINSLSAPTTSLPIKNESGVNILKEDFVPTKIALKRANPLLFSENKIESDAPEKISEKKVLKSPKQKKKIKKVVKKPASEPIPKFIKKSSVSVGESQVEKIKWKPRKGINNYFIDISKDKFFTTIIKTTKLKGNEVKIDLSELSPGVYYYRKAPIKGKMLFEYEKPQKFIVE